MRSRKRKIDELTSLAANALAVDPAWNARLAARCVTNLTDQKMIDSGFSSTQFSLMCLIASTPEDTVGALADRAGLNQSTISRNLDVLVRLGWVEMVTNQEDRRRRAVWLTEAGIFKLAAAFPLWEQAQRELSDRVNVKQIRGLAKRLSQTGAKA